MNEKRFKLKETLEDVLIEDLITQSKYSIYGIVDLLNEQSDTIEGLILDRNRQEEKLNIARRNLSKQLGKIEELEEENEQLKKQNIEYEEVQCKIMNYIIDKGLGSEFAKFLREAEDE